MEQGKVFSRNYRFVVYRQEKLTPNPIVLITATTSDAIKNSKELLAAVKAGITKWVKATDLGKSLYAYSGDDMNIGDIEGHVDNFLPYCKGIMSLNFDYLDTSKNWNYDTSLCEDIGDVEESQTGTEG